MVFYPSIAVKRVLAGILSSTGLADWKLKKRSDEGFVVLMYHRVIPIELTLQGTEAGMFVTPRTFKAHLRFLQDHFRVVGLEDLDLDEEDKRDIRKLRPRCALTFDDGWRDFYEYAFPILKEFEIPATVFLPTDYVGSEKWFWTDRLAFLIFRAHDPCPLRTIEGVSGISMCHQGFSANSAKEQTQRAINALKEHPVDRVEEILYELCRRWDLESRLEGKAFVTWEQVSEMKQSGLISFGSHTESHAILTHLSDDKILAELQLSMKKLIEKRVTKSSFIPFCYPNGNYSERIADMVRETGYSLALSTVEGWNYWKANPFTLKRICAHEDMTNTEALYKCRIAGLL